MTLVGRIVDRLGSPGRARRRVWVGNGRLHVEVRGLSGPRELGLAQAVKAAVAALPPVAWSEVDLAAGRVVVQLVADGVPPADGGSMPNRVVTADDEERVIQAVEAVEAAWGVAGARFPLAGPSHPGDREPVVRNVLALAADSAGLGFGVLGRVLRATPLPIEAASAVTIVDNEPRIRHLLEAQLGTPATDLGLAVVNAVGQSLAQGPLGLMADGMHRVNLLLEATARRQAFARAEDRRWGAGPASTVAGSVRNLERPVPLPPSPLERYIDRAALVGTGAAATTYATTLSARRATAMFLAAIPRAARQGREAFAAHLDRVLCERDMLVLDPEALRRLDIVDTLVVDGTLLHTGSTVIREVRLLGAADAPEVHRHLTTLFDPSRPDAVVQRGRWSLGPPDAPERRRSLVRRTMSDLEPGPVLMLRRAGRPVALATFEPQLAASVVHLLRSAKDQGHTVVLAWPEASTAPGVDVDLVLPGGDELAPTICGLQGDGCIVTLVAPGGGSQAEALRRADVGLEVADLEGAAWSGDVLLGSVEDAAFVLDAIGSAREVSRQSVALSATGSGIGALLSLTGPPGRAAARASTAVNLAAIVGIANGVRAVSFLTRHGGRVPHEAPPWHELDVGEVLDRLGSTTAGLSAAEAGDRQRPESDVTAPVPSLGRSMLAELANPLTPVLAGGAAASAAVGSPADAAIVAGVSALNAVIGGVQRYGAERAIASLSDATQTWLTVRRGDQPTPAPSDRLVPGDVVVLRSGDAVPADCRIISASLVEVDESSLTGESVTVGKDADPTFSTMLAERTSMLYEGTTIAAGEVVAVVVATGADTVANASLDAIREAEMSVGVEARLRALTSLTLPVAGAGGAAVLGLGLLRGQPVSRSVGSAVALAVAAVPEGLPILATMAQLASARRLSERGALVRNPRAIEALGRTRVLCTDKTGTLTEGRIRLRGVSDGETTTDAGALGAEGRAVVGAGLRASPPPDPGGPLPHLTDEAVVAGAERCGIEADLGAPGWTRSHELPFEPARGYHAVVGYTPAGGLLSVKGAPETVLERCSRWRPTTGEATLDGRARRRLYGEVDRLARQGLRILAVGEAPIRVRSAELADDEVRDLTFRGFLILADPVRATAAKAVGDLRAAGVEVLMVTGDHPSTAQGIAAELGILNGKRVITGTELAAMSDAELDGSVGEVSVFARVTPADKVRVVRSLQRQGDPVAMTGDGANDAPSIRLADVGIALGDHATSAARRAADLVVTDGRIETVVDAIIEGRAMWASLRDALAILLGGNVGEVAFTVGATAVTGRAPLSARQLLAVNLLTDVAPALAIALRTPPATTPERLLAEGPDASLGPSLERAIALRATSTALGAGMAWSAASLTGRRRRAGTVALVALVGSQLGQTLVAGGRDPLVLLAGVGSAAVMAGIVQTPGVSQFFGCTPLGPVAWGIATGSSVVATGVSVVGPEVVRRTGIGRFLAARLPLGTGDVDEGPAPGRPAALALEPPPL